MTIPMEIITDKIDWVREFEDLYYAWNKKSVKLGELKYERVGRHMRWCWYQEEDIKMSPEYLQIVCDMQECLDYS